MKINDVSKALFDLIQEDFQKVGFKLNRSKKIFRRDVGGVSQEIDFLFDKSSEGILLSVMLYVVNKDIEDVYYNATGEASNFHIGIDLFDAKNYIEKGQGTSTKNDERFFVDANEKVAVLAEVLCDYFNKFVIEYFSLCDSVSKIDNLLNDNPSELSIHHGMYPSRATIGLIAAKLNGNANFNDLLSVYDKETKEARESFRSRFELVRNMVAAQNQG